MSQIIYKVFSGVFVSHLLKYFGYLNLHERWHGMRTCCNFIAEMVMLNHCYSLPLREIILYLRSNEMENGPSLPCVLLSLSFPTSLLLLLLLLFRKVFQNLHLISINFIWFLSDVLKHDHMRFFEVHLKEKQD